MKAKLSIAGKNGENTESWRKTFLFSHVLLKKCRVLCDLKRFNLFLVHDVKFEQKEGCLKGKLLRCKNIFLHL